MNTSEPHMQTQFNTLVLNVCLHVLQSFALRVDITIFLCLSLSLSVRRKKLGLMFAVLGCFLLLILCICFAGHIQVRPPMPSFASAHTFSWPDGFWGIFMVL